MGDKKFISPRTHTIIGFVVGLALILAPNLFMFSDVGGAAVALPRILGIIIVLSELTVRGSFSGIGIVPMKLHVGLDILMGLLLALSPFLFGFADEKINAWLPHLVVGLMIIAYAAVTRTSGQETPRTAEV